MNHSFRNYSERLGYCFHSNGFCKNKLYPATCLNVFLLFNGAKVGWNQIGRWSNQQNIDAN